MPPEQPHSPLQPLARVLTFWAGAITFLVLWGFVRSLVPPDFGPFVWGLGGSVAVLGLIRVFLRRERRTFAEVGLGWNSRSLVRLFGGLGLGVATYLATLLLTAAVLGPIRFSPGTAPTVDAILVTVLGLIATALMEELAFRSYTLWTALRAIGFWPGQVLVAVAFSLIHIAYGWPPSTVLMGVLPSGLLFGAAAVVSRGLALPFGVHLGMNLSRWVTGEGYAPGWGTLDASALDPARTPSVAPLIGAAVPILIALALCGYHRRAEERRPGAEAQQGR